MQFLLSHCQTMINEQGSVLLTLLLAGLVSGFTHCAGMCGPFVMAQTNCSDCNSDMQLKRLSGAALLPYHLGRMTTYICLGVIAALLAKQIIGTPIAQWISVSFLVGAGCLFILSAMPKGKHMAVHHHHTASSSLATLAAPLFKQPRGMHGYALGVLLGLLPCSVIYAALMVVATTGGAAVAAVAMALFTLGTFPALFLVGTLSRFSYKKWPGTMRHIARTVMVVNGINLFALAGHMAW